MQWTFLGGQLQFSITRFLISLCDANSTEKSPQNLLGYLRPLQRYLEKADSCNSSVEKREFYHLFISYEEAKHLCSLFWRRFTELTNVVSDNVETADLRLCDKYKDLIEATCAFAKVACWMVEADLQTR
jgi:hypothetical protein